MPGKDCRAYALFQWQEDEEALLADIEDAFAYPVIKPANLGSSIGITMVTSHEQLRDAVGQPGFFFYINDCGSGYAVARDQLRGAWRARGSITSMCEEPKACDDILSFADKIFGFI